MSSKLLTRAFQMMASNELNKNTPMHERYASLSITGRPIIVEKDNDDDPALGLVANNDNVDSMIGAMIAIDDHSQKQFSAIFELAKTSSKRIKITYEVID